MKVVVFGGGKGQSALLRGLKLIDDLEITAIVTVADDGGSTGRLREEFGIPAMGDIRNVMLSLAESETLLTSIMGYRFDDELRSALAGHNLGNLIFTALAHETGSFTEAITQLSEILNVKGRIVPASTDRITLCAKMEDGTIVRGESNIPNYKNSVDHVYYDVDVAASQDAIEAIHEADLLIMGIGSIYTSILPNLIIPEIKEAIHQSKAKKVYYCNAMTQPGETDGFNAEDHVAAILKHTQMTLDLVVYADDVIPQASLEKYALEDSYPVTFQSLDQDYPIFAQSLLYFGKNNQVRHDREKIRDGFKHVLEALNVV